VAEGVAIGPGGSLKILDKGGFADKSEKVGYTRKEMPARGDCEEMGKRKALSRGVLSRHQARREGNTKGAS